MMQAVSGHCGRLVLFYRVLFNTFLSLMYTAIRYSVLRNMALWFTEGAETSPRQCPLMMGCFVAWFGALYCYVLGAVNGYRRKAVASIVLWCRVLFFERLWFTLAGFSVLDGQPICGSHSVIMYCDFDMCAVLFDTLFHFIGATGAIKGLFYSILSCPVLM